GVANTMVVAVLERRSEIGLRRALGATRRHITAQFLTEATILAICGGVAGSVLGMLAQALTSLNRDWPITMPSAAAAGSIATTILTGLAAGLYPAVKAAR